MLRYAFIHMTWQSSATVKVLAHARDCCRCTDFLKLVRVELRRHRPARGARRGIRARAERMPPPPPRPPQERVTAVVAPRPPPVQR